MVEMIPSVQERKKNVHSFMNSYPNLCRLQNTIPNPNIKINSSNNCLDFIGDRLKLDDWKPVLEAISNDKSLHFISVKSRHSKAKVIEDADTESQVRQSNTPKSSPLFTNYVLVRLTESLSKCLTNSLALTGLVLENIPLTSQSLNNLTQGLEACHNLQQLSLPHTQLGDDGCAALCHVLRGRLNLVWLNLAGCGLTSNGVNMLCNLLKFQKLNRYGESWKQSLRYRPVNPNIMPGLRRLTLNYNPIGDAGVKIFTDTLIDDLWLKALDLQHCEITIIGAEDLLSLLKENQFLSVVDIRGNLQVPNSLVAAVVQQLASNNKGTNPEFQWLPEEDRKSRSASSKGSTTNSRSTQRLLSSTSLASKKQSVLPSKLDVSRFPWSQPQLLSSARARSMSAKRTVSATNTPRPPWNWKSASNTSLRRDNFDHTIKVYKRSSEENLVSELHSIREKLHEVSEKLEEERERRIKIEMELESYKQLMGLKDSASHVDKDAFQVLFNQFYNAYISKHPSGVLLSPDVRKSDEVIVQKDNDSLDAVIRTINEGNPPPNLRLNLHKEECTPVNTIDVENNKIIAPNKAQQLFESLLSN